MKKSHLPDSVWIPLSNLVPPRQSPAHEASPSHGRVFPWVPQNNACGTMPSELVADSPHNERNGNGEKNRKVSSVDAFRKKEERPPPPPWALRDGSDTNGIGRRGRGREGGATKHSPPPVSITPLKQRGTCTWAASLTLFLSLSLAFSLHVSLPPSLSISLFLSHSPSFSPFLSFFLSLFLSLPPTSSLFFPLIDSFSLFLPLPLPFSPFLTPSLSYSHCPVKAGVTVVGWCCRLTQRVGEDRG